VLDGVPSVGSVPVADGGAGVPSVDGGCVLDGVALDGGVVDGGMLGVFMFDGVVAVDVLAGAENCEIAGLRSFGTSGRVVTAGCAGLGRIRSPRGIPWTSAWPLGGRGTASTKSDVAASAAS